MPSPKISSPHTFESAAVVTPSDTVNQAVRFRAVYVGTTGNLTIQFSDGTSATFLTVPVGVFPIGGIRVNSTGTTALNLLALY